MKAAAVQLTAGPDAAANRRRARALLTEAARRGARVVLLPELYAVPFVQPEPDPEYFAHAEPLEGPSNAVAREVSAEYGITVVSSVFEAADVPGVHHNTACTFVNGELAAVYRKSHLPFSNGFPEKYYFRPGGSPPVVTRTEDVALGTIICYERHFPELGRLVALGGASLMCVPVASASAPMREVFQLELRAQAVFNGLYVVCANRTGQEGVKRYFGTSAIYGPDGEILAEAGQDGEEVVLAEIDPEHAARTRRTRPFLRDRRPDLYDGLAADGA
ncbi:carbon-nitrogen hydrolase family protein [Streptomyces johnsoniae]|uniref:Nitrilase-related carbon-nitrogen hydrolase n=1 Tax=Streptomyces johnsoniae TaxID=3075532 RepID=A0ABU2S0H8_9ACTN|nr:nitrilase-related carbon-nitrogen hydrolase [Streptomyces sp. DSM 41886]MDT0442450.1 nitrilase-related carbon-nitrogen hydrolase [Streptomyces sp. DSM 41886]